MSVGARVELRVELERLETAASAGLALVAKETTPKPALGRIITDALSRGAFGEILKIVDNEYFDEYRDVYGTIYMFFFCIRSFSEEGGKTDRF